MRSIPTAYRRLALLVLALPVVLLVLSLGYQLGMEHLEGRPRTFGQSVEWTAETLTTTGYGRDAGWTHPVMQGYVVLTQFAGVFLVFLVVPVFLIPFLEDRFQAKLPTGLPDMADQVLIYRYGPAVTTLLEDLDQAKVPVVIFEEDERTARRLFERGRTVILGNLEAEDPDLRPLVGARGMVVNGEDDRNAAMTLSARYHGYAGPIVAFVANPNLRPAMMRAGATACFTPDHVLAAALATRASVRINPRVGGVRQLGRHLQVTELRVGLGSPLAGRTIAESDVRRRTGVTLVGLWESGQLLRNPSGKKRLEVGMILVAVGSEAGLRRLGELATPIRREGHFVLLGPGSVGEKVAELLTDAEEQVIVLDPAATRVGGGPERDPLDRRMLLEAGIRDAQAVIITMNRDTATLFATAIVRDLTPEVMIIAGASQSQNVARIHRAGADFVLSVSQVAGQLLGWQLLGEEAISVETELKLVAAAAGPLAGKPIRAGDLLERTNCSVVAVERGEEVVMDFDRDFRLEPGDMVYLCGTNDAIGAFFLANPETRELPIPRAPTAAYEAAVPPDGEDVEERLS